MRISCSWAPGGALTFRNKSSKIFETWGRNMQNISDIEKRFFKADPGKKLVQRDVAGAEAVIVGYLCKSGPYRDLAKYEVKHHSYIAGHLFKDYWKETTPYDIDHLLSLSIKNLSEHPHYKPLWKIIKSTDSLEGKMRKYYIGKKVGLSFNYEQGFNSFRTVVMKETGGAINLTSKESELFKSMYEGIFPEIPEWQNDTKVIVKRDKVIRNLFGHPFRVTSYPSDDILRKCIAWVPQSTVGVLAAQAMVKMQAWTEEHPEYLCDVLGNVHDSVVVQCPEEFIPIVARVLGEFLELEFASPVDGEKFKMKTELSVGNNLAKKTDDNPEGLDDYKIAA